MITRISRISFAASVVFAVSALGTLSATAQAQTFPAKPVRLLVSFGAGGMIAADVVYKAANIEPQ